jgi:hypothetical protein
MFAKILKFFLDNPMMLNYIVGIGDTQMTKLVTRQEVEGISTPCGADPKSLTVEEFATAGHTGGPLLDIIRKNCMDCVGQAQADVRRCAITNCVFWPYRMGSNPWRTRDMSDEQRAAAGERLKIAREQRVPSDKPAAEPTVFKFGDMLVTIKQKEALEIIDHRRRKLEDIHGKTLNKLIAYGWVAGSEKPVLTNDGETAAKALGVFQEKNA